MHPCDDPRHMPRMHWGTAPSTALTSWKPYAAQSAVFQPFQQFDGHTALGTQWRVT